MEDLEGGGKRRLVKETSGRQEFFGFYLEKTKNQMQEACLVLFLCLSSSVKISSGKQGWRWLRERRHSRSLQGEQDSKGKGFGSYNHV